MRVQRGVQLRKPQRNGHFFGRTASAVPWMKAWIFTTSSSFSLTGEVGHAATLEGPVEDDVLQVREIARLSSSALAAPSKRQAEA